MLRKEQNILVPWIQETLKEICNPHTQPHSLPQFQISGNATRTQATSWAESCGLPLITSPLSSLCHINQQTGPTDTKSQKVIYLATSSIFTSTTLIQGTLAFLSWTMTIITNNMLFLSLAPLKSIFYIAVMKISAKHGSDNDSSSI